MTKSLEKTPIEPNGAAVGSVEAPAQCEGGVKAGQPAGLPPPAAAARTAPSTAQAHLLGLPDQLPETWCPNCKANVLPKGKGHCPRCGRVLKQSFLSRKHPINIAARDVILGKLLAQFPPANILERSNCEHLA